MILTQKGPPCKILPRGPKQPWTSSECRSAVVSILNGVVVVSLQVGSRWRVLCHLELSLCLLLVHSELWQRLLQRLGLSWVELPLLLQDFGSLLILLESEAKKHSLTKKSSLPVFKWLHKIYSRKNYTFSKSKEGYVCLVQFEHQHIWHSCRIFSENANSSLVILLIFTCFSSDRWDLET